MKKYVLLLSIIMISIFSCVGSNDQSQPDILLIMPDQMRGDCLSILNHPVVRTPQLMNWPGRGYFSGGPIPLYLPVFPPRYALLTGLYPQTSGVVGYKEKTIINPHTLPQKLADAGYSTVLVGRNMHQPEESGDLGYEKRILGSTYREDDDYDRFLKKSAPQIQSLRQLIKDAGLTFNHWQATSWPLADDLHPTAWIVNESHKILDQDDGKKPLFLTTSLLCTSSTLISTQKIF